MSHRLASFSSPSNRQRPIPVSSPTRPVESTFHRKLRSLLQELRAVAKTWDELVLIDGLKAAKSLVDTRTELNDVLLSVKDKNPRWPVVTPRLVIMERRITELNIVVEKLVYIISPAMGTSGASGLIQTKRKQFRRMNAIVDNMEALLSEAHKAKGWQWVQEVPMWTTWPMERFVSSISSILVPYHRSLNTHASLVSVLRSHSLAFADAREAVVTWAAQEGLHEAGWMTLWEDLCAVEVDHWKR